MAHGRCLLVVLALHVAFVAGDAVADPMRIQIDVAPGAHFIFRGRELPQFVVEVDTTAGTISINGMSVPEVPSPLSDEACRDKWQAVLVDGAPRAVNIVPQAALASAGAAELRTSLGEKLVAFAVRLQLWLESPRRTPVLVAVAAGGGTAKLSGDASVQDALRQLAQFGATGSRPPGPLNEAFFR